MYIHICIYILYQLKVRSCIYTFVAYKTTTVLLLIANRQLPNSTKFPNIPQVLKLLKFRKSQTYINTEINLPALPKHA